MNASGRDCQQPFHTSRELPHPPVDRGPKVQCGTVSPQTPLIGEKENVKEITGV